MLKIKFILFSFLFSSAVNASENNSETRFKSKVFRTCTKISSGVKQKTINTAIWLKNHKKPIAISAVSTVGVLISVFGFIKLLEDEELKPINCLIASPFKGVSMLLFDIDKNRCEKVIEKLDDIVTFIVQGGG